MSIKSLQGRRARQSRHAFEGHCSSIITWYQARYRTGRYDSARYHWISADTRCWYRSFSNLLIYFCTCVSSKIVLLQLWKGWTQCFIVLFLQVNGGHDWYCFQCHDPGEVLECSECWRVYHPGCV